MWASRRMGRRDLRSAAQRKERRFHGPYLVGNPPSRLLDGRAVIASYRLRRRDREPPEPRSGKRRLAYSRAGCCTSN